MLAQALVGFIALEQGRSGIVGGPSELARIVGNAPNARYQSLSAAYLEL